MLRSAALLLIDGTRGSAANRASDQRIHLERAKLLREHLLCDLWDRAFKGREAKWALCCEEMKKDERLPASRNDFERRLHVRDRARHGDYLALTFLCVLPNWRPSPQAPSMTTTRSDQPQTPAIYRKRIGSTVVTALRDGYFDL